MSRVWRARLKEEVRTRIREVGRVRTLYKRKAVKVVPVDEARSAGIKPSGEEGWRERLIKEEKERGLDGGAYPGVLIPKFSTIKWGRQLTQARIRKLNIREHLTTNKRDLLLEMLFNREEAIAFDSAEKGRFHNFIEPPHVIPTVPHMAWQAACFRIPPAMHETSVRLIQGRLASGSIERSFGPHRNPWFLVEKPGFKKDEEERLVLDSAGKPFQRYRLINSAQKIDAVSILDASLPLAVEEFSERFAGYLAVSLVDLFAGYDQCTLDPASRDITAFHMSLGLMRMTTLPMEYTNAVQVFDRVMRKVLQHQILQGRCETFINGVAAKPTSRSTYPDTDGKPKMTAIPGGRLYILEAIQSLDEVLADIERAGGTISGFKSAFVCEGLKIVAFICDSEGGHPVAEKVRKIVECPACRNVTEARAFIGICVYYRAWIKDFSPMAEPIFLLFRHSHLTSKMPPEKKRKRKEVEFVWGAEQEKAMEKLKTALSSAPALKPLVYMPEDDGFVGEIVLGVEECGLGFGAILQQEDRESRRHPVSYESGVRTPADTRYDAVILECRGLLRALKKFHYYLFWVQFLIEIDARTLVHQMNQPTSDLPWDIVGHWLAYIRLFSFDIKHVAGVKHKGPDALSRRPGMEEELRELAEGGEVAVRRLEEFVDGELDVM